jgi:hypothetical protein
MREASAVVALWVIQSLALTRAEITALGFSIGAMVLVVAIGVAMLIGLSRASKEAKAANRTANDLRSSVEALQAQAKSV